MAAAARTVKVTAAPGPAAQRLAAHSPSERHPLHAPAPPRRRITAATVLAALSAPAATAHAASPRPSATAPPSGLYGAADPTYDGVWRQSYALLALHTAGVTPAQAAVGG